MPTITTITATLSDGTSVQLFPVVAPVAPTDVEIDVVLSDGTTKKFVPSA